MVESKYRNKEEKRGKEPKAVKGYDSCSHYGKMTLE